MGLKRKTKNVAALVPRSTSFTGWGDNSDTDKFNIHGLVLQTGLEIAFVGPVSPVLVGYFLFRPMVLVG